MRSRAAFTLVEVLIVLGIVALLATLVLPAGLARADRTRSAVAESLLLLAPSSAAAEARLSNTPLALVLDTASDGRLRLMIVRPPVDEAGGVMGGADAFGGGRGGFGPAGLDSPSGTGALDGEDPSTWPRVGIIRTLPAGVALADSAFLEAQRPLDVLAEGHGAGGGASDASGRGLPPIEGMPGRAAGLEADGRGVEPAGTVLAWFLTDGVALEPRPVVLRLPDGRVVRLAIEALTGRASIREINDASADRGTDASDQGGAGEDAGEAPEAGFQPLDRSRGRARSAGRAVGGEEQDGPADSDDRPADGRHTAPRSGADSESVPALSPGRPSVRRGRP